MKKKIKINLMNNKDFIYKNIQIFYENCNNAIYKDVLTHFANIILDYILSNIDVKDLEELTKLQRKKEWETQYYYKKHTSESLDIIYKTQKEIQKIINKNIKDFLEDSYEIFESVIYKY